MYTEIDKFRWVVPQKNIWEPLSKGFVVAFFVLLCDSFVSVFKLRYWHRTILVITMEWMSFTLNNTK